MRLRGTVGCVFPPVVLVPEQRLGVALYARVLGVDGDLACRWRVTFIERKPGERDAALPDGPSNRDPDPPAQDGTGPALRIGQALPSHTAGPFDRLALARLSAALDNPDPLHVDDEVARRAGFDGVIGQGSAVVGLLHETVRKAAGFEGVARTRVARRRRCGSATR